MCHLTTYLKEKDKDLSHVVYIDKVRPAWWGIHAPLHDIRTWVKYIDAQYIRGGQGQEEP